MMYSKLCYLSFKRRPLNLMKIVVWKSICPQSHSNIFRAFRAYINFHLPKKIQVFERRSSPARHSPPARHSTPARNSSPGRRPPARNSPSARRRILNRMLKNYYFFDLFEFLNCSIITKYMVLKKSPKIQSPRSS